MSSVTELSPAAVRLAAMNLLAMREHSAHELGAKLQQKFADAPAELVQEVLSRLAQEGLQSDLRFAEAFTSMRYRQGKGPLLVSQELRQRGLQSALIDEVLFVAEFDWFCSAVNQRCKRFGQGLPVDAKTRAKQQRFLASRGFSGEQIRAAFSGDE